jgi:hypothetical protein
MSIRESTVSNLLAMREVGISARGTRLIRAARFEFPGSGP